MGARSGSRLGSEESDQDMALVSRLVRTHCCHEDALCLAGADRNSRLSGACLILFLRVRIPP